MPTVFKRDGFKFLFYSNEGNPLEPVHIHIFKAGSEAKFWLEPEIKLARNSGFDAKTLRQLAIIVAENTTQIQRAWNEYFA